jgi:succinyl-diaminopimelate desuccinylase
MADDVTVLDLAAGTVALTQQICDFASVSGDERALADAIEIALRNAPHLAVTRNGDAIVARTTLGRSQRVVIAGHIDTVPINNNLPSRLEGDTLWGRGTVDMKGGVAVQLALAAELSDPNVDLTWIFYDNEEVAAELNGLARLAREAPELLVADFAILCEPTSAAIEGGCNGTARVDIRTVGIRAHSARPWKGHNAIHDLAPVLATLASYVPEEIDVDGLVYRESLNAVGIFGGVAGNVIPDEAVMQINYRFAPSRNGAEAIAHLRELFAGFDLTVADLSEGARPGLDAPLALDFVAAVGGEAKPKYGWTDVARFSGLGIPAVNYGPGDPSRAHADDERVAIAEIEACERGLRAWLTSP